MAPRNTPGRRSNGYLIIGANDDGSLSGLKVDDALLKRIKENRNPKAVFNMEKLTVFEVAVRSYPLYGKTVNAEK